MVPSPSEVVVILFIHKYDRQTPRTSCHAYACHVHASYHPCSGTSHHACSTTKLGVKTGTMAAVAVVGSAVGKTACKGPLDVTDCCLLASFVLCEVILVSY